MRTAGVLNPGRRRIPTPLLEVRPVAARRSISAKELRAECLVLERSVLSARLATKELLQPYSPGGAENRSKDARGWLGYYRHLHRVHARIGAQSAPDRERADAIVLDALRAHPVAVALPGRPKDSKPIHVYPKSLDALLHIHALDQQLAYMTRQHAILVEAVKDGGEAKLVDLLPRVLAEITYTYHLLAWIVTTKGPGMPFSADDDRPEVPDAIAALEPWDVIRIWEAHQRHLNRLAALTALIDANRAGETPTGKRPSWSAFIGTLAMELDTPSSVLMRDQALVSLLATVQLNGAGREQPSEAA